MFWVMLSLPLQHHRSAILVPANAPDSLPTASHRDISDLATIHSVSALSDEQRYHILTHSAPKLREYPTNSQKRRFQPHWSELFPWISYSISVDGVFCAPCFLFSKARLNSEFVSTPFRNWKNATGASRGALNRHSTATTHQQCVEQAAGFKGVVEKRAHSIKSQLSEAYDQQVQANRAALLSIVDSIQFLVRQGLGLRGSNWDKGAKREDGNFSSVLDLLSKYSPELESHILH